MAGCGRHTFALLACLFVVTSCSEATVTLPFGTVSGNVLSASREFLGIPFAPKPARFASAQLWNQSYEGGHLDATSYAAQCLQTFPGGAAIAQHATFSEDCLYLTLYTPRKQPGEPPWPVMFWIHGGALRVGSAMATNYNASVLAARGRVVVVAANYRLGFLGFASVSAEPGAGTTSNQDFRDQRVALRWVRAHVAAFGGDPSRVTLFGESAGGDAVGIHVVSVGSGGLFTRAIMQSGGIFFGDVASLNASVRASSQVAQSVGCLDARDLPCLQQVPAATLLAAAEYTLGIGAVVDGDFLNAHPLELVRRGSYNEAPFILGTMLNEGNGFLYPPLTPLGPVNASVFQCVAETTFGANAPAILQLVPPDLDGDNRPQLSRLLTDIAFLCPTRDLALALAAASTPPWAYSFERHPHCAFLEQFGFGNVPGAPHGDDVVYVFDNFQWLARDPPNASYPGVPTCAPAKGDLLLADRIVDLWAGFAKHGKAVWPRFSVGAEQTLKINLSTIGGLPTEIDNGRSDCELLKSIGVAVPDMIAIFMALSTCGDPPFAEAAMYRRGPGEDAGAPRLVSSGAAALGAGGLVVLGLWTRVASRRSGREVAMQHGEQQLLAA